MSETVKRTNEIEEITNLYIVVPVSYWLIPRLAKLRITPNMVSLTGMACGILSAVLYRYYEETAFALAGFLFMYMWHILDGADGGLARYTNSQSEFGKVLDGICDYVTFISVYVALALAMEPSFGAGIWFVVVIAGICHAIQAGAYQLQRQEYDFWGYGKKSAELSELTGLKAKHADLSFLNKTAVTMANSYALMQYNFSGLDPEFRPKLRQYMENNPDKIDDFRASYRKQFASVVRRWNIMCANYRTYAIFIACIIKQPILYFGMEIVFLNLVLIMLIHKQKKYNRGFLRHIEECV